MSHEDFNGPKIVESLMLFILSIILIIHMTNTSSLNTEPIFLL